MYYSVVLVLVLVDVVVCDVDVLVLVDVDVDVDVVVDVVEVDVVVCDVLVVYDIVVDVEVELEVELVVPTIEHHSLPLYRFHSNSPESKYVSPSTGLEGCELATFIRPMNPLNFDIFLLLYLFFIIASS